MLAVDVESDSGAASNASLPEPTTGWDSGLRIRLDLSYDGTGFSGWARQPGLRTVQGVLTEALETVLRSPVALTVAGRTDAGVHARGQVAHIDISRDGWQALPGRSDLPPDRALLRRLAGVLPSDVVVRAVSEVPLDFDARFSALWRRYTYRIHDGDDPDPLTRTWVLRHRRTLDEAAMDTAVSKLVGEHDFLPYCKPRDGATTIRTLQTARVCRVDGTVQVHLQADAFCHSMVRAIVGSLLAVGEGRREPTWPADLLQAGERTSAIAVAPACGLVLEEVAIRPPINSVSGLTLRGRYALSNRRRLRVPRHFWPSRKWHASTPRSPELASAAV